MLMLHNDTPVGLRPKTLLNTNRRRLPRAGVNFFPNRAPNFTKTGVPPQFELIMRVGPLTAAIWIRRSFSVTTASLGRKSKRWENQPEGPGHATART